MTFKVYLCWSSLFATLALSACQSGPPTEPPSSASAERVVVPEGSLLLENIGALQTLTAQTLDAEGNPVEGSIVWESSNPAVVSVDQAGNAKGHAVGSALLRARSGDAVSAPILASVGSLAETVVRIESSKIVAEPVFPVGVSPFDVGKTYTVILQDVSPTVGKLWFSKTSTGFPVMGEIVSSRSVATGTEVTLEIVPMATIFSALKVYETLELVSEEVTVSEDVKRAYNVQRARDGTFTFTPKTRNSVLPQAFDIGPFRCNGDTPPTTFDLGTPSFTLNTGSPTFRFVFDLPVPFVTAGRASFLFTASPQLTVSSGNHRINTNFNGLDVACKIRNGVTQTFSALGFSFEATLTPGLTLGGSYGAGSRTFSARARTSGAVRLGFDCRPPAGCTNLTRAGNLTAQGNVSLGSLGTLATTIRDLKAGVFADVLLSVRVPFGKLDLFEVREGYEMTFDLASVTTQIADNNPADYQLRKYYRVDPFTAVKSFVELLLGSDAADSLGLEPLEFNELAAQSPLVLSASIGGSTLLRTVDVLLDDERDEFFSTISPFGLGYNIQSVQLIEVQGIGRQRTLRTVSSVSPRDSQLSFQFRLPRDVNANNLYVAIVPNVLSELPLGIRRVD